MTRRICLLLLPLFWAGPLLAAENNPLTEARTSLQSWVQTRQLISKTKLDWQADKETLGQTILAFERALKGVEEQSAKLTTNSTEVEKQRLEAEALLNSSKDTIERARVFATEFQSQVAKLVPQLPAPLQEKIQKDFLPKLPAVDATNTQGSVSSRIQTLLGILNECDKFNNAVSLFTEKRKNAQGEEVSVDTVYVGLGAAYFVNDGNNFAGTGRPGPNGWEWEPQPALASHIRDVVRIYKNERAAQFVPLPVAVR